MGADGIHFGADTSTGLLPPPHLLLYYGIFFAFGVLYFDAEDKEGRLGRRWWLWFLVSLPFLLAGLITLTIKPVSGVFQVLYTWGMIFGLIGLFRRYLSQESPGIRYVSDSSYWLYLAHLPLVIALQAIVRDWPQPALLKFLFICVVATVILLLSYHYMVRYTWIGRLLNGPRRALPMPHIPAAAAAEGPEQPETREQPLTRSEQR
jgi:peptidoglycan/LPS O-acetylase OafA/YrhL